jgi:hypothetical protein
MRCRPANALSARARRSQKGPRLPRAIVEQIVMGALGKPFDPLRRLSGPIDPPAHLHRSDPHLALGGPGAGRKPAMKPTTPFARLDPEQTGVPFRVRAPQRGRALRRSGVPSPASQDLSRFDFDFRDRRSSRGDASGPSSLGSREAAAAWRARRQSQLGAQPPFAVLHSVFERGFGEPMLTFNNLLLRPHEARDLD